jgi:N-acetylglucosamine-6-phosphate deacetylase
MNRLLIHDCRLVTPEEELEGQEILVGEGRILAFGPAGRIRRFSERLEAEGRRAAPGLIDVHVQGAGGADVLDGSLAALEAISRTCARFGVTGFLATTVYRPGADNGHLAAAAAACGTELGGAELLGIHLEGPFIAPGKRGMIQPDSLAPVEGETLRGILELTGGCLRMMTLAPELPGCLELIAELRASGVVASFGHSEADYEQTRAGIEAGIRHATHLFNAMRGIHHRDPGPIPALLEAAGLTAQLIADGVHIHPAVLRMALHALGPDRAVLITDGMQAMGLPEGRYLYRGLPYESRGGTARYTDGTLVGTTLGLSQLVGRCCRLGGLPAARGLRAASLNAARLLGLEDRVGALEPGRVADLVLLDADFSAWRTFKAGRCIHAAAKR